jgi:hypothetical protein
MTDLRAKIVECLEDAEQSPGPGLRMAFLRLSLVWDNLATTAERARDAASAAAWTRSPFWSPGHRVAEGVLERVRHPRGA